MRGPGSVRGWTLVVLVGCGRVSFDPVSITGSDGPVADAAVDAPVVPADPKIWLQMETDPTVGIVDSAGSHTVSCGAGGCPIRDPGGVRGGAYEFSGTAQDIRIRYAADLDGSTTGFTSALWVEIETAPGVQSCVFDQPFALGDTFVICVQPDGSVFFDGEDLNGNPDAINGNVLSSGAFHHLAFVWDASNNRKEAYVDGLSIGTSTVDVGFGTGDMSVGSINGELDEVLFYTRPLSASEVRQLATR